ARDNEVSLEQTCMLVGAPCLSRGKLDFSPVADDSISERALALGFLGSPPIAFMKLSAKYPARREIHNPHTEIPEEYSTAPRTSTPLSHAATNRPAKPAGSPRAALVDPA